MLPRAVIIGMNCNAAALNWCSKYLDISREHLLELEILMHIIESADPKRSPYIRFPFVTRSPEGLPVNWYIGYDNHSWWQKLKRKLGICDDLVAVSFHDGHVTLQSLIYAGVPKHRRTFNLADPNSLLDLGKRIFKLLT